MQIVIVSDTHGLHFDLPKIEGDLLIHCGDFEQTADIDTWFDAQNFQHVVAVAGNHDYDAFEKESEGQPVLFNATLLHDESIEIKGLKIYGSPWINELEGAAYSCSRDEIIDKWEAIPSDTDILITHVPPYGILDLARNGEHWGCQSLVQCVESLNLRFHCFGHVHASYGIEDRFGITFINASNISGGEIVNPPIIIEI